MRDNIEKLLAAGVSNYQIYKDTGMSQSTLSDLKKGKTSLDSMKLINAERLNEYYNKIKGEIKMENIFNTISNNYKIEGEDGKHAQMFVNKEELLEEIDQEIFQEKFLSHDIPTKTIDDLQFPIITFDESGSDGGRIFEADSTREEVLTEAIDYFTALDDDVGVWEFETYNVFEETDVLRFENKGGDVLGYVAESDDVDLIEELNKGNDPIDDKWEDGVGNTIGEEGWGE